jgi:uncharacterized membrane protein
LHHKGFARQQVAEILSVGRATVQRYVAARLLVAWDCATGLYLILATVMMARSNLERVRNRAALQDEGQILILLLAAITALISLGGTMAQMAAAKTLKSNGGWQHIAAVRGDEVKKSPSLSDAEFE